MNRQQATSVHIDGSAIERIREGLKHIERQSDIPFPHMNPEGSQSVVKRSWRIEPNSYRVIPKIIGAIHDQMPFVDWSGKHKDDYYVLTVTANCDGDEECRTATWVHEKLTAIFAKAKDDEQRQLEIEWREKPDANSII